MLRWLFRNDNTPPTQKAPVSAGNTSEPEMGRLESSSGTTIQLLGLKPASSNSILSGENIAYSLRLSPRWSNVYTQERDENALQQDWSFQEKSAFKKNVLEMKWMPINPIFNQNDLKPHQFAKYLFDKFSFVLNWIDILFRKSAFCLCVWFAIGFVLFSGVFSDTYRIIRRM